MREGRQEGRRGRRGEGRRQRDRVGRRRASEQWIASLSQRLGERTLSPEEIGAILQLARDVAHGQERRLAPLATFLAGLHVGRRASEGSDPESALSEAVAAIRELAPSSEEGAPEGEEP